MSSGPLLSLVCALASSRARADAADTLARHVGATAIRIFVRDTDLGILVCAQGLPPTMPEGPAWEALLHACRQPGEHHGDVEDAGALVPATAYVSEDGTVLVFVGSHRPDLDPGELVLPLLGALFGAEQRAWAAAGQAAASTEAARHANALTAALDRSRGELEGAIQAKQQLLKDHEMLLGIVGHDLRNPLNTVVMGTSMLLERGDLPAGHIKTLQRIKTSSHRMVRMIADLLDFERSREGTIPITRQEVGLRDVVAQVLEELEVSHPTRTLEFVACGDGRGSWDADRLAQVVSNLVGNALQHSPPDAPVTISLAESAESVIMEVSNTHRGPIGEEDLRRIFEPFRRGKESTGLGLGLYIVQQIARAHGGSVSARSESERTTFSVALPRR